MLMSFMCQCTFKKIFDSFILESLLLEQKRCRIRLFPSPNQKGCGGGRLETDLFAETGAGVKI